ncbi:ribulose-phosphate 3-epimerase [Tuberibacillus calidus]|jgi:ribulose-phosphate 3-epimerase|uniref:ribulose-phosphate 3-epimerase n=1 Tax=Tuberibacillus calidus TaxID=340097 RepID=UPI0004001F50|nr:ribulose-phosphate 3-epimerase [Tuberibacillus calidus]
MITILPSILAADFSKLGDEVRSVEEAGVEMLHIDVMDGHFVPNISMGPLVVQALKPITRCAMDVHLMIEDPDRYISDFARAGCDRISVHAEACPHLHRTIQLIKQFGLKAGVALNPATPIDAIRHVVSDIDFVLIMTVNPGFGGQAFIPQMVDKIAETSAFLAKHAPHLVIQVDGGINKETIKACYQAGAREFVAGSAVFNQPDRTLAIKELQAL